MKVLTYLLGVENKPTTAEVNLFIWVSLIYKYSQEVDDDLDGYVSKEEFLTMYKRCISDETGLEPRKLFNLV